MCYKYSACFSSHYKVFTNLLIMVRNYTQSFEIYFYFNKKKINHVSEKFNHPCIISDGNHGNLKKYSGKNQGAFFLDFCSHPVNCHIKLHFITFKTKNFLRKKFYFLFILLLAVHPFSTWIEIKIIIVKTPNWNRSCYDIVTYAYKQRNIPKNEYSRFWCVSVKNI